MPATLTLPRQRRESNYVARMARLWREGWEQIKAMEPTRISVCSGCHLLSQWPAETDPAAVVRELVRWAADPALIRAHRHASTREWWWTPGEQLAVWHAGRLLALLTLTEAGRVSVRRFTPK